MGTDARRKKALPVTRNTQGRSATRMGFRRYKYALSGGRGRSVMGMGLSRIRNTFPASRNSQGIVSKGKMNSIQGRTNLYFTTARGLFCWMAARWSSEWVQPLQPAAPPPIPFNIRIAAVEQSDLEYDPALYRRPWRSRLGYSVYQLQHSPRPPDGHQVSLLFAFG